MLSLPTYVAIIIRLYHKQVTYLTSQVVFVSGTFLKLAKFTAMYLPKERESLEAQSKAKI